MKNRRVNPWAIVRQLNREIAAMQEAYAEAERRHTLCVNSLQGNIDRLIDCVNKGAHAQLEYARLAV